MVAKKKSSSPLSKQTSLGKICCVSCVTLSFFMVASLYLWYCYERLVNRQQLNKSTKWHWFNLIPTNKDTDTMTMNILLEIVQEDLNTIYFFLIQTICLLIPREITSIISAAVLVLVTILTFRFTRSKKDLKRHACTAVVKSDNDVNNEHLFVEKLSRFRVTFSGMMFLLIVIAFFISIPWEYVRLFQIEVAKRMAVMENGIPKECYPDQMTITQSIRYWLLLQLSWQHDPCEKYHKALLVDPLWEITPLMVVSSVITRSMLHPIELFFSGIGKSFRLFFSEIPVQWQPIMLVTMTIIFMMIIVMICGYRISLPLLLNIEPKTPIFGRFFGRRKYSNLESEQMKMSERKKLHYHS